MEKDINRLSSLWRSGTVKGKLIAINVFLFILTIGANIGYWIGKYLPVLPGNMAHLAVGIVFAFILSVGYTQLIENMAYSIEERRRIHSMRVSSLIMLIGPPLAMMGFALHSEFMVIFSTAVIPVSFFGVYFGSITKAEEIEDKIVKPRQLREILGLEEAAFCFLSALVTTLAFLLSLEI